jgi:acyl carrier protein
MSTSTANNEVSTTILAIVKRHLEAPDASLHDSNLVDLGLDSMKTISMLLDLESCFQISFPDDQLAPENFRRFSDVELTVKSLLAKKPA